MTGHLVVGSSFEVGTSACDVSLCRLKPGRTAGVHVGSRNMELVNAKRSYTFSASTFVTTRSGSTIAPAFARLRWWMLLRRAMTGHVVVGSSFEVGTSACDVSLCRLKLIEILCSTSLATELSS